MMTRRVLLGNGFAAGLSGCGLIGTTIGTYRFRLTLAVDTPQGVKTASSVLEATYSRHLNISGGQISNSDLKGEAVFLDLGGGKSVIMLLAHGAKGDDSDTVKWLPVTQFTGARLGNVEGLEGRGSMLGGGALEGKAELKPPDIPTLITFSDLANPASAKVVYSAGPNVICGTRDPDPRNASGCAQFKTAGTQTVDRFAEAFGPGYAFGSATLEMVPAGIWPLNLIGLTGTPVTRGIEGKMPLLVTHRDQLYRQSSSMNGYVTMTGQFKRDR